ncbi:MAG: AAA family ATPase [Acidobacteriota bacterium]
MTLSHPRHLEILEAAARRCKADIIIVDTLTAAFEIENENDNAEGSRIMKKADRVGAWLNCVVVFLHHIGKTKQEDDQTSPAVHRGRGGSSNSGFSHVIFSLLTDPMIRERVTLECAKNQRPLRLGDGCGGASCTNSQKTKCRSTPMNHSSSKNPLSLMLLLR